MRKIIYSLLILPAFLFVSSALNAQVVAAGAAGAVAVAPHLVAAVPAVLTGAVSAGSAHIGQAVVAKLASASVLSDGTKLPAGAQLLGKVTQAVPLSKGNNKSSLGMVFDRFKGSDGQEKPLGAGIIQSIGSRNSRNVNENASASADAHAGTTSSGNSGGGLLGGVVGGVVNGVGSTVNGLVGAVTGLPGVLLDTTGTLVAQGKNVSVPSGTRLTVAASADASAQ